MVRSGGRDGGGSQGITEDYEQTTGWINSTNGTSRKGVNWTVDKVIEKVKLVWGASSRDLHMGGNGCAVIWTKEKQNDRKKN